MSFSKVILGLSVGERGITLSIDRLVSFCGIGLGLFLLDFGLQTGNDLGLLLGFGRLVSFCGLGLGLFLLDLGLQTGNDIGLLLGLCFSDSLFMGIHLGLDFTVSLLLSFGIGIKLANDVLSSGMTFISSNLVVFSYIL